MITMDYSYVFLILLLPALSFILLGLAGMKMSHKTAGLIGTTSLGVVTVLSYLTAISYFTADRAADGTFQTIVPYNFTWLPLGNLHFDMGILLDPISVMMLIVISTVSLMVHIYSFGYMKGEKGFQRYYAFLSLFTMSMLGLVVATNIFQMYLFWELVGVSSYLLIGFYYPLGAAVSASKKAFIVTRFADLFFLIGILVFGYYTESFSFSFANADNLVMGAGTTPFLEANTAKAVAAGAMILPTALVPYPCCYDGSSRSVPDCAYVPALDRICSSGHEYCGVGRCVHRFLCSCCGLCTERHQACLGLLYNIADSLYDGGSWRLPAFA